MLERGKMDRDRVAFVVIEHLVPAEQLLRKIDAAVDFNKLYETVEPLYCEDNGRPSIDPVLLFKMVLIQHLYGLHSLRRTADEISLNVAYRWFLGYTLQEETPHFSTVSYNFRHRFTAETADKVFAWILSEVAEAGYSWIHVTGDTTQKRAYLTEGPLKGDIASYFANNALFVCLGGVNAHKGLRETLQSLGVTEVMEAMDMDQFTNPQVRQAIGTLRREVQSIPGIRYYQCTWNPRFKGVDDYLLDWTKRRTA